MKKEYKIDLKKIVITTVIIFALFLFLLDPGAAAGTITELGIKGLAFFVIGYGIYLAYKRLTDKK